MAAASPLVSAGCPYTARRQFARLTRSGRWRKTLARTRANRPPTANIPVAPAPAQLNKRVPFPTAIAWEEVSSSRGGLPTETDHGQHPLSDMPGPRLRSHLHSPTRRNHPTNRSTPHPAQPSPQPSPQPSQAKAGTALCQASSHRQAAHRSARTKIRQGSASITRTSAGTVEGPAPGDEDEPEPQQKSVRCPATHHRTSGIRPRAYCRGLAGLRPAPGERPAKKGAVRRGSCPR